jgi:transcription initiation factor IIE alpha subunit
MVLFQDSVRQAVRQFRSGPTLRVLLVLPTMLDWRAWRLLDQQALADELCIDRSDVCRCLRKLIEAGYIERRGKTPRHEWRLLPKMGWRGSVASYHQAVTQQKAEAEPLLPLGPVKIAESILWKVTYQSKAIMSAV